MRGLTRLWSHIFAPSKEIRFEKPDGIPDVDYINHCRSEIAARFVRGRGIEVGAGSRPFPLPPDTLCFYGDVRDSAELADYFHSAPDAIVVNGSLNAQTFEGIPSESQDFVVSAHVIEHLEDPIGSIRQALRVLKRDGVLILVVPDRRHTFDRDRPATSLDHLRTDALDGGTSTRLEAYEEHVRYVHRTLTGEILSEERIRTDAQAIMKARMDVHFHCWTTAEFLGMLKYCCQQFKASISAWSGEIINENIFVVKKL
jgi:SAM-dependent methyltransferase